MSFLQNISKYKNKIALICQNNEKITYNKLCSESKVFKKNIKNKALVFLLAGNNKETLVGYISLLMSDSVILFINENIKYKALENLIKIYNPNYIFGNKIKVKNIKKYNDHGVYNFLIGETILKSINYELIIKKLLNK